MPLNDAQLVMRKVLLAVATLIAFAPLRGLACVDSTSTLVDRNGGLNPVGMKVRWESDDRKLSSFVDATFDWGSHLVSLPPWNDASVVTVSGVESVKVTAHSGMVMWIADAQVVMQTTNYPPFIVFDVTARTDAACTLAPSTLGLAAAFLVLVGAPLTLICCVKFASYREVRGVLKASSH